ncbi:MAG: L-threonylcarbamoyladenylate synthase [Anaerovoracaceae bacterium]
METKILGTTTEEIDQAAQILSAGGLVAFPTETVYGLGADALNEKAVAKVYAAKGRPSDNPMIVHISSKDDLSMLTVEITEDMEKLSDRFWPGPMTMIVKRRSIVPDVTTGGLDTVGVRMPSAPEALELIRRAGCPVAAPSANLSGKPSPTCSRHVIDDLNGRIDAILCGGQCQVGIESTVIDMTGPQPMILRPGIITREDFERVLEKPVLLDPTLNRRPEEGAEEKLTPKAPGMKYKHYAPKAEMIVFEGESRAVEQAIEDEKRKRETEGQKVCVILFVDNEQENAAHDLFARLRQADQNGADVILSAALTERGIGFSVMNRMLKSAGYNIKKV